MRVNKRYIKMADSILFSTDGCSNVPFVLAQAALSRSIEANANWQHKGKEIILSVHEHRSKLNVKIDALFTTSQVGDWVVWNGTPQKYYVKEIGRPTYDRRTRKWTIDVTLSSCKDSSVLVDLGIWEAAVGTNFETIMS